MYKLAIFDMDGTLLDTLSDLAQACNYALGKCGFPTHETEEYKNFIGHGPIYLVTHALPESNRDGETVKKTREIFAAYYWEHSLGLTKPYDGMLEALKTIKDAGVKIAVYTNKPHDNAVRMSEIYFPGLVDLTIGLSEGAKPKPDPTAGLEIIRHFGVAAEEAVYIGDSGVDMQTGKLLGAYTVGVSWGFRPKTELEELGSDVVIDEIDELIKIIIDK